MKYVFIIGCNIVVVILGNLFGVGYFHKNRKVNPAGVFAMLSCSVLICIISAIIF